jgi:hypothetical protein
MTIDWQTTLTQLDAAPNINTPAGQTVLKTLLDAGRAYDAAGKPDVLYESDEHRRWAALKPSQRIGQIEPPFYTAAYYTKLASLFSGFRSALTKVAFSAEDLKALPSTALTAYRWWLPRDPKIAYQIASYYIAKAEEAAREEASARSPTLGAIESRLVSAIEAANAFLSA